MIRTATTWNRTSSPTPVWVWWFSTIPMLREKWAFSHTGTGEIAHALTCILWLRSQALQWVKSQAALA